MSLEVVPGGGEAVELAGYSDLDASVDFVQTSFDLSAYAGQTVQLRFTSAEDDTLRTSFCIDDTAID